MFNYSDNFLKLFGIIREAVESIGLRKKNLKKCFEEKKIVRKNV